MITDAPANWIPHTFNGDRLLPRRGEIIKMRYHIATLPFNHGPRSVLSSVGSRNTAINYTRYAATHHVLVISAAPTNSGRGILLSFFPIMSYSNVNDPTWDAAQWLETASYGSRLHHIPIPAVGWDPAPIAAFGGERLAFEAWVNARKSWVVVHSAVHVIEGGIEWFQHSPPVLLHNVKLIETLELYQSRIPALQAAGEVPVHIAGGQVIEVRRLEVPDCDAVWKDVFSPSFEELLSRHKRSRVLEQQYQTHKGASSPEQTQAHTIAERAPTDGIPPPSTIDEDDTDMSSLPSMYPEQDLEDALSLPGMSLVDGTDDEVSPQEKHPKNGNDDTTNTTPLLEGPNVLATLLHDDNGDMNALAMWRGPGAPPALRQEAEKIDRQLLVKKVMDWDIDQQVACSADTESF